MLADLALLVALSSPAATASPPTPPTPEPAGDEAPPPAETATEPPPAETAPEPPPAAPAPQPAAEPGAPDPVVAPPTGRKPPRPSRLPPGWAVDLSFGTAVPISIGTALQVEFPRRLLGADQVGGLPGGYVDLINAVVVAAGGYDSTTASIIRQAIQRSFVLRVSAGWRPFKRRGFEFRGGYTLAALGGGVSAVEAIELATGQDLDAGADEADIPLRSATHSFHIDLGWRWVIREHFLIRTSLGYLQTVAATTTVEHDAAGPARTRALTKAEAALDTYLGDLLTTYVKAPVISLQLGYRF